MPLISSIAIDGPAGSGKSTIAKMLSAATGLPYLSTGEMYRAIALCTLRAGASPDDAVAVLDCAKRAKICAKPDSSGGFRIFCGEEDVTSFLRSPEVSKYASSVAVHEAVRRLMVDLQRQIAVENDVIMDGRDIGTVVLKESKNKIYLDASVAERARRRLLDYKGDEMSYEQVLSDLKERDKRDSTRLVDPLRPAEDALVIDSSDMTPSEVIRRILYHIGFSTGGRQLAE